jgi:hypothetical protein
VANDRRIRALGGFGTLASQVAATDAVLAFSTVPPLPTVDSTSYLAITIEPDSPSEEVVYVTSFAQGAATAVVLRGREGTLATSHPANAIWLHGPTTRDVVDSPLLPPAGTAWDDEFDGFGVADYSTVVLPDGPAGYWRLNEAAASAVMADSSGNALTATFASGTFARQSPGLLATDPSTAWLGNASAYATVPHNALLAPAGVITVEAWVRPASIAGLQTIAGKYNATGGYELFMSSGQVQWYCFQNAATYQVLNGPTLVVGTTYHLVAVYDGTTQYLYVNGALYASAVVGTGWLPAGTSPLYIGQDSNNATRAWNGAIDELAIYGKPLPAARVSAHYQAGATGAGLVPGTGGPTMDPKWLPVNPSTSAWAVSRGLLTATKPTQGNANDFSLLVQPLPATRPWEFTLGPVTQNCLSSNANLFGLVARESSTGKFVAWVIGNNAGSHETAVVSMTNPTTFAAWTSEQAKPDMLPIYLRVRDDGTNFLFSWSLDGVQWQLQATVGRTAFMAGGADQVGVCVNAYSTAVAYSAGFFRRTL